MRLAMILAAAATLAVNGAPALAKGCLRGAAAGGVAGHYVGRGHAVMGALAGCAVTHHYYAKQAREQRAAAAQARRH